MKYTWHRPSTRRFGGAAGLAASVQPSVIRFEAEGFRAKIYRTVQDNHHRRHTWEVSVSGRAMEQEAIIRAIMNGISLDTS